MRYYSKTWVWKNPNFRSVTASSHKWLFCNADQWELVERLAGMSYTRTRWQAARECLCRDPAYYVGRGKASYFVSGLRAGLGFWGGAVSPLPTSYGVWGSAVSSPSGVRGTAPAAKRFNCLMTSPGTLGGQVLGGVWPPQIRPCTQTDDPKTVPLVLSIGRAEA